MNKYPFNIAWSEEDKEYVATCPAFAGLSAYGDSEEEALAEAKVALGGFIKTCEEKGIPLPEPQIVSEYSGQTRLRLPKSLHCQAAQIAEIEGVSLNQLIVEAITRLVTQQQLGRHYLDEIKRLVGGRKKAKA